MQAIQPHILNFDEVQPGDVILCCDLTLSAEARDATGLGYSHAGICLETGVIADMSLSGIKKRALKDLFQEYAHGVVLRQPNCWDATRVTRLRRLVEDAIKKKTKFNTDGIRHFKVRREQHEQEMTARMADYFEGATPAPTGMSDSYFCSELVAALYIRVGFVGPSAAVEYDPAVISPAHLKNGTYGYFAGYLVAYEGYKIPESDDFYGHTPYHVIFGEPQSASK